MLTIAKLAVGQENYYLAKVATGIEDYYTGHGETPGVWLGHGAARIGLAGEVTGKHLRATLAGLNPIDGTRLAGQAGHRRVPGWDLTFSAPKSVSVLYGLGDPEVSRQVVEGHEMAVAEAIRYLERHAVVSRRRSGRLIEQVRAEGLVIAAFRHRTSRAGDPHLHTHALAANVVERIDGGWGAIHSPVMYRHAQTAGFVYKAILRGELTKRLGVTWGRIHNGYAEIEGIDQRLADCFSKRHAEIEEELEAAGEASARAADIAQRRTKTAKEYGVDPLTLQQRWASEARDLGFDPDRVVAGVMGGMPPSVSEIDLEWAIDEMVAAHGLTAQKASFDRRDVTRAWCQALPAGVKVSLDAIEDLTDQALADGRIVSLVGGPRLPGAALDPAVRADGTSATPAPTERRWSTTDMLAVEQQLLERADASRGGGSDQLDRQLVEQRLKDRRDLTDEQADMVRRITTSGDGVEVVVGRAGTGKTYALAAAAQVWREAGYQPIGVALAARAAAELESSAGIPSTTVAQFLLDADQAPGGLLGARHIVVCDEASMIDTRRLARLMRHVEAAGAKVVLVGDHHQLPAVEAGGAFAALVHRLGATELSDNRRQSELWERDTLDRLRVGEGGRDGIGNVVASYGQHGRLHCGTTPAEVRAAMVADWYEARRDGARVAMVALRRSDVTELNYRARALLMADGSVAVDGMSVDDRTFTVGDRVVCLHNDRRLGVHNAQFGTVSAVHPEGDWLAVDVDGTGEQVMIPRRYVEDRHLDYAYATTIHKAQGATYDRTLLLGDDRLYRQAGYASLSRGRDRNDMYLVIDDDRDRDTELDRHAHAAPDEPLERLVSALHRDGAKLLASDETDRDRPEIGSLRPLSELWAERDRLAGELGPVIPPDRADVLGIVADAADHARLQAAQASEARAAAEERAAATSPWRRRATAEARRDLARATADEQCLVADWRELDEQSAELKAQLEQRAAALEAHQAELTHLSGLERAIERRARLAGHAAEIDRPEHVVALLGDPPLSLDGRGRWRDAAGTIESYCARWGQQPGDLSGHGPDAPQAQVADLREIQRRVALLTESIEAGSDAAGVELG
jgi:conjugative relaxase-like TrwC/TraI family protein